MTWDAGVNGGHDAAPLIARLVKIGVADATEENFDLDVVFGGIAALDGCGSKGRSGAGNGIGFCFVHESDLNSLAAVDQLARDSDYGIRWPERYPDSANLLPISVVAWIFVQGIVN